jgi:hypothetical protein
MLRRNFSRPVPELQKYGRLSEIVPDPCDILKENPAARALQIVTDNDAVLRVKGR